MTAPYFSEVCMGKKVTLKQIAEIAEVSLTTVHRVLNGKGGCSKEVEDKILKIAKESGYYVSPVTPLQSKGPLHIAMVFPRREKEARLFINRILDGYLSFRDQVSQFNVVFQEFYFDKPNVEESLENLYRILKQIYHEQPVHYDGVVIYGLSITPEAEIWINRMIGSGTKVIVLERSPRGLEDICSVEVNDELAGNLAGEMLAKCIHMEGSVVIFEQKLPDREDPNAFACEKCLREYRPELNIARIPLVMSEDKSRNIQAVLQERSDIAGVYVTSARHTRSLLEAFKKTEIKLQAAIGSELFEESYQALQEQKLDAIIDKRPELIGYEALKLLFTNLVKKEELPISHKVTPRIVLRANSEICYKSKEEERTYGKDSDFK